VRWRDAPGWPAACGLVAALVLAKPGLSWAQHGGHSPGAMRDTVTTPAREPAHGGHSAPASRSREAQRDTAGARHGEHLPAAAGGHRMMPAFYGRYAFTREASGTAWQAESSPHEGRHAMRADWSLMLHGFAFAIANRQGGPRGADDLYSTSMLMGMATRPMGPGRLGLRAMLSLDPLAVGKEGYPLLLQTGETADGRTELIDRQHPHDLVMELAASYALSDATRSLFLYAGLPGEPALGPPVFMHRYSGRAIPESPIGHHWLDSTHITYGVLTAGVVQDGWKVEASAFRGREPDQERYDIESPRLDSFSGRLSWNPAPSWALQVSAGRLSGPEQLEPEVDVDRTTFSAIRNWRRKGADVAALAAWGRNRDRPGNRLDVWLLEGTAEVADRRSVFLRAERAEKDELFPEDDPRADDVFIVGRIAAGYIEDLVRSESLKAGIGVTGSVALVPEDLKRVYGDTPLSGSLFVRVVLR